jgi:CRP-like cAMP-binding protein
MEELKRKLARAKQHSAKARDSVARQRALILDLEQNRRDTSMAEDVLRTMIETQHLHELSERKLIEELKSVAPEEWRLNYAEKLEAPPGNRGNKLLQSLAASDLALLQPLLERVALKFRSRLQLANRTMKFVHFPQSGMISVMAVNGGGRHKTQIGLIGREGMTGIPIVFGSMRSPFDIEVEIEGQSQCIETDKLSELMVQSPSIRTVLTDYLRELWLQFTHTAAANTNGTIEQRLARLLLLVEDRLESEEIRLTHGQLAAMLSVRRAGVTVALQHFESSGLIHRDRALITISDRTALQVVARPLD